MKALLKFFVRGFALIGFLVMLVSAAGWTAFFLREKPKLPNEMILTLDLRSKIAESQGGGFLDFGMGKGKLDLNDMVAALDLAAKDPRVKVVIGTFRDDGAGWAEAQELRDAVARLRAHGKMTFATATSFGELTPADKAYYVASAFEQIWLQPVGLVGLTGLVSQMPFLRGSLDKIGAKADFVHREEYKTAMDMMTEHDFTAANAEMVGSILDDITTQVADDIAADRHIAPLRLFQLIDQAPLSADKAKQEGLIDQIGYFDEVIDWAVENFGDKIEQVDADKYLSMRRDEIKKDDHKNAPVIALIHAVGEIAQDEGLKRGNMISADDMSKAIEDAVNDRKVEALLVRIDSPGGSAVASETVRYALHRAHMAGLPVIISMGGMAGSGAYWLALEGDTILADPATLTGSIGVIAGKVAGTEVWDKLGINWGMMTRGENADMWSPVVPFTDAQRQHLDDLVGEVYGVFKDRVATGRDMAPEMVAQIARGRVWTGHQALQLGLIDELGSFHDAVTVAKSYVGLAEDDTVMLKPFPAPESFVERISKSLSQWGGMGSTMQKMDSMMDALQPVLEPAASMLSQKPRALLMPATGIAQ